MKVIKMIHQTMLVRK